MNRFGLGIALTLVSCMPAIAGSMPPLPELPPLPTDFVAAGGQEGTYAGILAGGAVTTATDLAVAAVFGTTTSIDDLLVGAEALTLVDASGAASLNLDLRAGFELDHGAAIFAHAGLGYATTTASFLNLGASIDFAMSDNTTFRAQYQHAHDLSGDPTRHSVLTGVLFRF